MIIVKGTGTLQKEGENTMKINGFEIYNAPATVKDYTVVRMVEGRMWFYMTFADARKAFECATEIGGYVLSDKMTDPDM